MMENRFGFKDLVFSVLLIAILVSIWVAMKQFDLQKQRLDTIEREVQLITRDQAQVRQMLEQGLTVRQADGPATRPAIDAEDPFARLKSPRTAPDFAEGDWIIDAFGTNVASITPLVTSDAYGRAIQDYVLESLITVDPQTLEQKPFLAESWQIQDNRAAWQAYVDGRQAEGAEFAAIIQEADCPPATVITFELRRGVVFSDGMPLTSADVVFSWELMNRPELNAPAMRQFYDDIRACRAEGPLRVVFELKQPNYLALGLCGGRAVLPKHFYERFTPEQINRRPGLLLGSGPYRMPDPESWAPGRPLELVRSQRYWGTAPAFDRVIYREITNDVARLTAFRNGEIDLFSAQPEQYDALRKDASLVARTQHHAFNTVPSGYNYIAWNQRRGGQPTRFADRRVREAMTFLTERHRMCEELFLGYAEPATGPFPRGSRQRDEALAARAYDVVRGRALLKEAGWEDRNGDGIIENAAGEPFRFRLMYPAGSELYDRLVLFLKDSYARAGIILEPDPLEFSVMIERLDDQNFDAVTLAWGGGAVEGDIRQMFHSSQVNKGGHNFMHYVNAELDQLIDAARAEQDEAKRFELWQACHRLLYADQPYTFMFNRQALRFVDGRFRNVELVTTGMNQRNEWYTPMNLQKWGR